jgi:hypothetical protein
LFFLNLSGFILRLPGEEMFPPIRDGKNGMDTLRFISVGSPQPEMALRLTSNTLISEASSSKLACTTSTPSAASFRAESLPVFLVTARTVHPGVFFITLTTPPPWEPVAPVTATIFVMFADFS